ncbi:MAG: type I glyceraldehyde-3-phosphate dehydrogenase [Mollicutes bacterium PWAP]|nr:type I glyceraldehyde-3-phosphate dehydrogenase [Mollicutes bacterium PWAP]
MAKKIAINGFGRIGRMVFRQLIVNKNVEIVAINDLTNTSTLAHLLKYDTAHGKFNGTVDSKEGALIVNGKEILVTAERDPKNLPWGKLNIDIVVESTGFFVSKEASQAHITAGAKKVLISAPAKGDLKTIVYNVNHNELNSEDVIVSAASCTTNALAPVAHVLNEEFGIKYGFMTTIHAYTGDQGTQDRPHGDLRRARAGAANFVPTTTGAAVAVGKVLPSLNGRLDGIAVRGPIITGSLVDLVVKLNKNANCDDINNAMKKHSNDSLGYTSDPIVSSDIIGETHGSIFDSLMTKQMVVNGEQIFKMIIWYDNENSYVSQYVRTLLHMISL